MKCPECGHNIIVPQNKATRMQDFIVALEANHQNRAATARQLGVSKKTIYNWTKRLGLKYERPQRDNRPERTGIRGPNWTKAEIKQAIAYAKDGWSVKDIARFIKKSESSVRNKLRRIIAQIMARRAAS